MDFIKVAVYYFVRVINMLILVRVLMSWVIRDPRHPFAQFIYGLTEPILSPFRQLLRRFGVGGMLDFSPILALLTVQFLASVIYRL